MIGTRVFGHAYDVNQSKNNGLSKTWMDKRDFPVFFWLFVIIDTDNIAA